ncbi:thiamine diphosphokinase [Nereida sp. MMG025]|uniref:thiamine diphosphokinase n=1 Tax=Nereida sp. MMG025 TaxID=2909981 RepID=UPI001F01DE75|nr:thiamine diphosphokinase [Nereida sp. MMG025]MCF6443823.1 thiamine diphosphokinase [Nereida sp. MMG025]
MTSAIVHSSHPVALIGGGKTRQADWVAVESLVNKLVAADGGARTARALGLVPDAVIGDLDSIDNATRAAFEDRLHPIWEQDSTDFDKALRHISAPLVLGLGFLGKRVDHQLAAFSVLARYPDRKCILVGKHDVVCLAPAKISLTMDVGERLSLFPLGEVKGTSHGLEWPIDDVAFAPDGRIGTSNRSNARQVYLTFEAPKMVLITPRAALASVVAAVTNALPWPARVR